MEKIPEQQPGNCLKIVLFGPESTGKTTLSRKLSEHYNGTWVPEFAREYLQQKWDKEQKICEPQDIFPIALGQRKLENTAVNSEEKIVFCDTDLLETMVYSEAYFDGWCEERVREAVLTSRYDLYILTYIDVPWQADDLRDRPGQREEMFRLFEQALIQHNRPYMLVKGNLEERIKQITNQLNTRLN